MDHSRQPGGAARIPLADRGILIPLGLAAILYLILITDIGFLLPPSVAERDFILNSMLDHLLRGRMDVDPAIVGQEGFTREGRVYAYWGVLPALLRLPFAWLPGWQQINFTPWYCAAAVTLGLWAKLWTVRLIAADYPTLPRWLIRTVIVALILSGAQIAFLRASIYQEVCFWAATFGALFVAGAVHGVLRGFTRTTLTVMALACAGALLTRVSVAVGLFAAFGMLALLHLSRSRSDLPGYMRSHVPAAAILLVAIIATALINHARWGDPLTFADYSLYNFNITYPDRLDRTVRYGLFNIERVPFGLVYYFLPFWAVTGADGQLLLSGMRDRLIDAVELPPSSFFLTDPLLLILAVSGVAALAAQRARQWPFRAEATLALLGLAAAPLLMLTAISMNFRYRMDFYALIEFAAFLGLIALAGVQWIHTALARRWLIGATVTGILGSLVTMLLYKLGDFGPAQLLLRNGLIEYYAKLLS